MRYPLLLGLVGIGLIQAGCGSRTETAKSEPAKKQADEPKKKAGEIILSAEAQKTGGIEVLKLQTASVSQTITATGQLTVNEDQTWIVGALLDGRIVSVNTKVGDMVKQGDVLARIHSHEVHDARAAYKTAQLELARAKMNEAYHQRLRDRAKRLLDLKAASPQELDTSDADLRNAQAAVHNATITVEKEKTHIVEFLDIPLEDKDEPGNADDYVPVKSPAAGLVVERKATPGTVVSSGNEIFRITSPSTVWMIASVNESDLGQLRVGQSVRVLVRAYPDTPFRGRILRLGEQLDPTTRTLQVRVQVDNAGGMLKPEMFATAEIERDASRKGLYVPESAAQELNGARVVFVRTGPDRFEPRSIEVLRTLNSSMEVVAGLKDGDEVVVKGSFILKSQLLKSSLEEED